MKHIVRAIAFILAGSSLLGCATPAKSLNESHKEVVLSTQIIIESSWAVDRSKLDTARAIEILSFGGKDGMHDGRERMTGDFYNTFDKNSIALMSSLFGISKGDLALTQAEYILRPQIARVSSKAGVFAFSDATFEIEIQFTLICREKALEKQLTAVTVKGSSSSKMGTGLSYHDVAHKRANDAINEAFLKAQTLLFNELCRQNRLQGKLGEPNPTM